MATSSENIQETQIDCDCPERAYRLFFKRLFCIQCIPVSEIMEYGLKRRRPGDTPGKDIERLINQMCKEIQYDDAEN